MINPNINEKLKEVDLIETKELQNTKYKIKIVFERDYSNTKKS